MTDENHSSEPKPGDPQRDPTTQPLESVSEALGDSIGPYKLLEILGEGGMGTVYLAEQREPLHRRVALKLIKLGMDTKEVIARFEAERQALAMMDHANVAKVFDAGATEHGRPYFVMELVRGEPLTKYCDRHRLTIRERLELFVPVCQAVHHAHQKGVIHRDIKPSNILVSVQEGEPIPKVIDFGVAKATNHRLTKKTVFTNYGQIIGTPAYMSPEQAEMTGLNVDTTTDVYSLGAVLYELLTGKLVFESRELLALGIEAMHRMIREKDPVKPSTRVSQLDRQETNQLALLRGAEPAKLPKHLRGELDWIVMKALEKDRTRRYQSTLEFSADIRRHFASEPVLAGPPAAGYRLSRFARRNRGALLATGAVFLALVLGLGATWSMYLQAQQQRMAAKLERDRAVAERDRANYLIEVLRNKPTDPPFVPEVDPRYLVINKDGQGIRGSGTILQSIEFMSSERKAQFRGMLDSFIDRGVLQDGDPSVDISVTNQLGVDAAIAAPVRLELALTSDIQGDFSGIHLNFSVQCTLGRDVADEHSIRLLGVVSVLSQEPKLKERFRSSIGSIYSESGIADLDSGLVYFCLRSEIQHAAFNAITSLDPDSLSARTE